MDGTIRDVLGGLHQQLDGCECLRRGRDSCPKCLAVLAALAELESVPEWYQLSEEMEAAKHAS